MKIQQISTSVAYQNHTSGSHFETINVYTSIDIRNLRNLSYSIKHIGRYICTHYNIHTNIFVNTYIKKKEGVGRERETFVPVFVVKLSQLGVIRICEATVKKKKLLNR